MNDDIQECSICFEDLLEDNKRVLECNHEFHVTCVRKFANNVCPLCRNNSEIIRFTKELSNSERASRKIKSYYDKKVKLIADADLLLDIIANSENYAGYVLQWFQLHEDLQKLVESIKTPKMFKTIYSSLLNCQRWNSGNFVITEVINNSKDNSITQNIQKIRNVLIDKELDMTHEDTIKSTMPSSNPVDSDELTITGAITPNIVNFGNSVPINAATPNCNPVIFNGLTITGATTPINTDTPSRGFTIGGNYVLNGTITADNPMCSNAVNNDDFSHYRYSNGWNCPESCIPNNPIDFIDEIRNTKSFTEEPPYHYAAGYTPYRYETGSPY